MENWLSQSGASMDGSHGWLLPGHQEAQPDVYAFQQTHPENFLFSVFFFECKIKFFFFQMVIAKPIQKEHTIHLCYHHPENAILTIQRLFFCQCIQMCVGISLP